MNNIRDYYRENYPSDELGVEINDSASLLGLYHNLIIGNDVYEYIGVGDSVIRERCFEKLAEELGVSYDYIYDLWLEERPFTFGPAIEFTVCEE